MEFRTSRLLLAELIPSDVAAVHQLHSQPEVDRYNTLGIPENTAQTASLVAAWIAGQDAAPRTSYTFCIRLPATDQFIGLIALNLGKPKYRIAEVWYKIFPEYWGQGYTTEALKALLAFGFDTLQLHRIEAGCAAANTASKRVLEKAGMTFEGCQRKVLPIRGEWADSLCYALLETDPRP